MSDNCGSKQSLSNGQWRVQCNHFDAGHAGPTFNSKVGAALKGNLCLLLHMAMLPAL